MINRLTLAILSIKLPKKNLRHVTSILIKFGIKNDRFHIEIIPL